MMGSFVAIFYLNVSGMPGECENVGKYETGRKRRQRHERDKYKIRQRTVSSKHQTTMEIDMK